MNWRERFAHALARPGEQLGLLNGDDGWRAGARDDGVAAAVLVPVIDRAEPTLLLTQLPETMRSHPGQVALPGVRIDPGYSGPIVAALREAREEVALDPEQVEVIGLADRVRTVTGFVVTPVVGFVPPDLPLFPHEREVAAIFEAPLHHLLAPENQRERSIDWGGRKRHYYEIDWEGRRIWGATAAMIVNLSRRLGSG